VFTEGNIGIVIRSEQDEGITGRSTVSLVNKQDSLLIMQHIDFPFSGAEERQLQMQSIKRSPVGESGLNMVTACINPRVT